ncbi:dihydroxyacetone kinase phosphoryl donor subunit DhaM [Brachyspira hyodysenteriae]|uniref:dihydroxyacetone kinase phosphoryl donor subunit DhaM n=1 Tax=Brachyspira hyodysenteriae TaxID=159 RepID=UPI00063DB228|nr:dihydroxyacetone kinase phosphoryl donor subunit DhaM [Brachyspira hyodysenteriae]AUJ50618.1 PTS sugar transporter [Brachyspira hyodysenteriae]KLI51098.1 PTS sugar transporter [Brachyspira hyodysenteriae]TVL64207.1 PTS sugar transporter [Brachyspira hyodysenteriae]TVL68998.1 PTS sugar transporter [Brachyspira hyodysenteriae]TVL70349.1 PTS sugar transporter [Brachyspira hyodysenteriae]
MVSLIFVSHSYKLAKITAEYIKEVTNTNVEISFSGGSGDDHKEIGTDAVDVFNAIERVYSDDGVIIFCDLGSALISSELAISMLDEDKALNVRITSAPFIEGGINAAIQSSLGKNIDEVINESLESLTPKISYVKDKVDYTITNEALDDIEFKDYVKGEYKILLENGFHARPVFMFINLIANSKSEVYISNKTKHKPPVSADSITKVTLLNIEYGDVMEIYAKGPDADQVLERFEYLVNGKFETKKKILQQKNIDDNVVVVSDGCVSGRAIYMYFGINVKKEYIKDTKAEKDKFNEAIENVKKDLLEQKSIIEEKNLQNNEYLIFETYISMLFDDYVLKEVYDLIDNKKYSAAYSYNKVMRNIFKSFDSLDDGYIKERKYDIEDILHQVLKYLLDIKINMPDEDNIILMVDNIYASIVTEIGQNIKGVISINGSAVSHAAILLKSLNIPYVIFDSAMQLKGKDIVIDTKNKEGKIIHLKK